VGQDIEVEVEQDRRKGRSTAMNIYKRTSNVGPTITITNPITIGWILLFFGLIFGVIGIVFQWNTLAFLPGTVSTTGTIIQCKSETTTNSQGNQINNNFPVVSFQAQSGQQITFKASESDSSCFEGGTVKVIYHPDNPHDARLNAFNAWLVFIGFGFVFILLGLINFLRGIIRKVRRDKSIANC
jgi:hypothetical protein